MQNIYFLDILFPLTKSNRKIINQRTPYILSSVTAALVASTTKKAKWRNLFHSQLRKSSSYRSLSRPSKQSQNKPIRHGEMRKPIGRKTRASSKIANPSNRNYGYRRQSVQNNCRVYVDGRRARASHTSASVKLSFDVKEHVKSRIRGDTPAIEASFASMRVTWALRRSHWMRLKVGSTRYRMKRSLLYICIV